MKNYYGDPTLCSNCGKPTEKKRVIALPNITCAKCKKENLKIYHLKHREKHIKYMKEYNTKK